MRCADVHATLLLFSNKNVCGFINIYIAFSVFLDNDLQTSLRLPSTNPIQWMPNLVYGPKCSEMFSSVYNNNFPISLHILRSTKFLVSRRNFNGIFFSMISMELGFSYVSEDSEKYENKFPE